MASGTRDARWNRNRFSGESKPVFVMREGKQVPELPFRKLLRYPAGGAGRMGGARGVRSGMMILPMPGQFEEGM
jgi:hypothetical protein